MIKLEQTRKPKGKITGQWIVKADDGNIIGVIEKYSNTKNAKHPWKAFSGVGETCRFINSFYDNEGGKNAAIQAIVKANNDEVQKN